MADDDGAEHPKGAPAGHGGKGKGHGLGGLLQGSHRNEIITICSVVGVLLAWLTLRRTKTPGAASGMSADGTTSAAQAGYLGGAGNVAGFDQSAVQTLTDNVQAMGTNEQAMFQQLSDSFSAQNAAQTSAQQGLSDLLTKQQSSLTAINTSISGLPQAIANVLPKPLPAPAPVYSAPAPAPSGGGGGTYTVRSGDNLSRIGARFGESWQTLYAKNRGVVGGNPNLIRPGEVLTV